MTRQLNQRYALFGWLVAGVALALALAYILYHYIGTVLLGLFLYYTTRPVFRRVSNHVENRTLAASVTILVESVPILALILYTTVVAYGEASRLAQQQGSSTVDQLLTKLIDDTGVFSELSALINSPAELLTDGANFAQLYDLFTVAFDSLSYLLTGALHIFVALVIAFYLLRDGPRLRNWFETTLGYRDSIAAEYVAAIDRDFHRVFFGNILTLVFTGVVGVVTYSLLNLFAPEPYVIAYPALLGVLCGAASIIPFVGMKLVYVPVAAFYAGRMIVYAHSEYVWFLFVFIALSAILVDAIPDLLLRPYVSGRNIHVGLLMVAYTFGPLLFGWYGLFLGPVLAVLALQFASVVVPRLLGTPRWS
jgi:predicted PurR-regulated permease PerM